VVVGVGVPETRFEEEEEAMGVPVAPATVDVAATTTPVWRTRMQLPKPEADLKETRQRLSASPPVQLVPGGKATVRSCGPTSFGSCERIECQ
jgi:hypothetical protein